MMSRARARARARGLAAIIAAGAAVLLALAPIAQAGAPLATADNDYADAIAAKEQEKQQNEADREALQTELEDTNKEIVDADARLRELNARLPVAQQELEFAEAQLSEALFQQKVAEDRLAAAVAEDERITLRLADDEQRLADLQAIVGELARAAYRGDDTGQFLRLILGSASTEDFVAEYSAQHTASRTQGHALAEIEQIAAVDRNLAARQDAVREYIEELKIRADQWVQTAATAREAAEARKTEIEGLLAEAEQLRQFLEQKKQEFLDEQQRLKDEYDDLRIQLLQLQRAASGENILSDGTWGFPTANPYITSPYGYRLHPIYGVYRLHAGTDFRAYCGTPIYAAADGIVVWTKVRSGYGNQVMINHGKIGDNYYASSYSHLSRFAVSPDDVVLRGMLIGYAGTTGSSTACHLHFEVYINGATVDPMSVL